MNATDVRAREISRRESVGSLLLWFGVLGSPSAWALQLVVNYSLEEWFACSPSASEEGQILGVGVDTFATVVTSTLALVALAALVVSIACYRRLGRTGDGDVPQRARWMALAGIFNGVLYTLMIVVSYGPAAILDVCRTTP